MSEKIDIPGNQESDADHHYRRVEKDMVDVARDILKRNREERGLSEYDWRRTFVNLIFDYLWKLHIDDAWEDIVDYLSADELQELADEFIKAFNAIDIGESLYEDVRSGDGFEAVGKVAGEINFWTAGDQVNKNQISKFINSGIPQIYLGALAKVKYMFSLNPVFADDKVAALDRVLNNFVTGGKAKDRLVVLFDDKPKILGQAGARIEKWASNFNDGRDGEKRVKINTLLVRALRGTHKDDSPIDDSDQFIVNATDLFELSKIIAEKAESLGLEKEDVLVLLDFDGALSDNKIVKKLQSKKMYQHLSGILKAVLLRYVRGSDYNGDIEASDEDLEKCKSEVRRMFNSIIFSEHFKLRDVLDEMANQTGETLDEGTVEELSYIDEWLVRNDCVGEHVTADDLREKFWQQYSQDPKFGSSFSILSFDGKFRIKDRDYFFNKNRKSEDGSAKKITELLFSDEKRVYAIMSAAIFEVYLRELLAPVHYKGDEYEEISLKSYGIRDAEGIAAEICDNLPNSDFVYGLRDLVGGCVEVHGYEDIMGNDMSAIDCIETAILRIYNEKKDQVVEFENQYIGIDTNGFPIPPLSPITGVRFCIKLSDEIPYELRIRTVRVAAIERLLKQTVFDKRVKLSPSQVDYIWKMAWGANLADIEEEMKLEEKRMVKESQYQGRRGGCNEYEEDEYDDNWDMDDEYEEENEE